MRCKHSPSLSPRLALSESSVRRRARIVRVGHARTISDVFRGAGASCAVLVGLYEEPERPPNAVDYIKRYMGAPTGVDVEALRTENEQVRHPMRSR